MPERSHNIQLTASLLQEKTMRITLSVTLLSFLLISLSWLFHLSNITAEQIATETLPGAQPTIQAAHFPTIQAALDSVPKTGGHVRLPAGTFRISEPLRVTTDDTCLEGAGTATHIVNTNENGQPAILLANPDISLAGRDTKHELWRIRLANLRVTGNPQSGHGIEARGINEIFVDGVTVSNHGGDGILLNLCYEDPRLCDSLITYNKGVGVNLLGCHDIVVSSNQFEENQDALHCKDGFNLCMTGNCLDDHLGDGVLIENTYGSVLSGNMIEECNGTAIILDRDCYGITLSANVIAHNGAGIDLRDAHGSAISANTLTIMKTMALRIGPQSSRIAVTGNSFSNSFVGNGTVRRGSDDFTAAGIFLDATTNVGIVGNTFSSVRPQAIASGKNQAGTGLLISGNLLVDVENELISPPQSHVENNLARD